MKLENAHALFGQKYYFGMTSMTTPYARVDGKLFCLSIRIALEAGGTIWASDKTKTWMLQPKEVG